MNNVESPNHYTAGYIEVIYAIHDVLGREGFKAFCMGNYIKYNARANHKGLRAEDLAKADQYLEWATNGLPDPVDGRVPRQPDIYEQFAKAMAAQDEARIGDGAEGADGARPIRMSPELAAGYAIHEAAERATAPDAEPTDKPTAESVANVIGPVIENHLGWNVFRRMRLRVTKNQCEAHEDHVWFTARIYDRMDNSEIIRAEILTDTPDDDTCIFVGQQLALSIEKYLS